MHSSQIRQPTYPSRTISNRATSGGFMDKALQGSFSGGYEDPASTFLTRRTSFTAKNPHTTQTQIPSKQSYQLYKIDQNLMPQLLDMYSQANLYYRDEEFSQQADQFLTKIAMDRKIPDVFRARYPIYQILVSLSKIFMFNEYEIVVFACVLDHCPWNLDDVMTVDQGILLHEFPSNFGLEVANDCKRFIIYLLIVAFSLKQYLGEKSEVDQIQAYCEHICGSFQDLFNRWTRALQSFRFNYSLPEINRKFRHLAKKDLTGYQSSVKDYNMMVDEIMGLTGSYTARTKEPRAHGHIQSYEDPMLTAFENPKIQSFHDMPFQQQQPIISEPKPMQMQGGINLSNQYGFSDRANFNKPTTYDFGEPGLIKVPSFLQNLSMKKEPSINTLLAQLPMTTKQPSLLNQGTSNYEDSLRKKIKIDENSNTGLPGFQSQPSFMREPSTMKMPEFQHSFSSMFRPEDFNNMSLPTLPLLSKKSSVLSQGQQEDIPSLSRFQSNLSFLYENNK